MTFVLLDHLELVVLYGWVVVAMLLDLVMEDDDIVRRHDDMKTPTSSPLSLFQRVRTETRSVREL